MGNTMTSYKNFCSQIRQTPEWKQSRVSKLHAAKQAHVLSQMYKRDEEYAGMLQRVKQMLRYPSEPQPSEPQPQPSQQPSQRQPSQQQPSQQQPSDQIMMENQIIQNQMSRNSLLQSILANPSLLPTENPPGMDQSPVTQGARGKIVDMLGNVIMNNSVAPRYRQWAIQ